MPVAIVSNERIHQLYSWCSGAFANAGRRFKIDKNTPPEKTYHWRYLKTLAAKIDEYEFDDPTAKLFIETIASYASRTGLKSKGLAVFFQGNILEICKKELDSRQQKYDSTLSRLEASIRFVNGTPKNFLFRAHPDAMQNLVEWYRSKDIYDVYLAYSKSAYSAFLGLDRSKLPPGFPTANSLYLLRLTLGENRDFLDKSKILLQNDWRGAS